MRALALLAVLALFACGCTAGASVAGGCTADKKTIRPFATGRVGGAVGPEATEDCANGRCEVK